MTSHLTDADIDLVLDRDTAEHLRAQVLAHVDTCSECRSRWTDVLRGHEALTNLLIDVPTTLASRATAAAQSDRTTRHGRRSSVLRYAAVAVMAGRSTDSRTATPACATSSRSLASARR